MKRLFNKFMKEPGNWSLVINGMPAEISILFNKWMVRTMNHPTEFANKFMIRKFIEKLT